MFHRTLLSVATIATLSVSLPALADPTTYSGKDLGVDRNGARPNSNAAAASFDTAAGALPGSAVTTVTFENFSLGTVAPNNVDVDLSNGIKVRTVNGRSGVFISNFNSSITGFSTTAGAGNTKFLSIASTSIPYDTVFTFNPGVTGFGGFFTGIGNASGTVHLAFNDGSAQDYNLSSLIGNSFGSNGGVGFFGFIDEGKTISTLSISLQNNPGDVFGMDDLRFVRSTPVAAVPEPGEYVAMAMAGLWVCGLMLRARRKQA